jgi:uncharacterized protein (TIGR00730 family)
MSGNISKPQNNIKSVCVYCGSSFGDDTIYKSAAREFGEILAAQNIRLVYGGGGVGLMGETAKAVHDNGGKVLGIMPQFLRSREILYDDVDTRVVTSMHERKMMLFEESDAFVVFPGGIGTLEEVIELLSWRRLDLHKKPIVFANINAYWQPLFDLIEHTISAKFTPSNFGLTYRSTDRVSDIMDSIYEMATFSQDIDARKVI